MRSLCLRLAAALLCLSACSEQLYTALDETAANQVVSALRAEGIDAEKTPGESGAWRVLVPNSEFARSVQVLERRNLPAQRFDGLGVVFKKESLVSTLTEERARLIHAMSRELERTLSEIDGVLVARVHPVIPPHDPLNPKKMASSASVLIKYRQGAEVGRQDAMVRSLVAAGIEGLSYDEVRVHMVPADPQPLVRATPKVETAVPPVFWGILGVLASLLMTAYFALNWRDRTIISLDELRGRLLRARRGAAAAPEGAPAANAAAGAAGGAKTGGPAGSVSAPAPAPATAATPGAPAKE